jgi:hypothetical protein
MPRAPLDQLLAQLHRELSEPERLDAGTRLQLEALRDDIEQRLDHDRDLELVDASLMERLDQAVDAFESRHPELTLHLRSVIDAFRALGFR